jgi:hypothetical protein
MVRTRVQYVRTYVRTTRVLEYHGTRVRTRVPWYVWQYQRQYVQHYLKNDLSCTRDLVLDLADLVLLWHTIWHH